MTNDDFFLLFPLFYKMVPLHEKYLTKGREISESVLQRLVMLKIVSINPSHLYFYQASPLEICRLVIFSMFRFVRLFPLFHKIVPLHQKYMTKGREMSESVLQRLVMLKSVFINPSQLYFYQA